MAVKNKTIIPVAIDNEKLPVLTKYAESIGESRAHVVRQAVEMYMKKVKKDAKK